MRDRERARQAHTRNNKSAPPDTFGSFLSATPTSLLRLVLLSASFASRSLAGKMGIKRAVKEIRECRKVRK